MAKKSATLSEKLNKLFLPDPVLEDFELLVDTGISAYRFDSRSEFESHLMEGALLNVNKLSAKALSIPVGEYLVWVSDVGHTMLVPTQDKKLYGEVFGEFKDSYDLMTPNLLDNWSNLERVLSEEEEQHPWNPEHKPEKREHHDAAGKTEETPEKDTSGKEIKSRVNPADIDRHPILRAMEDRGYTVTSLAHAVGVQAPMISRLLRTPKDVQGDPGGRNPSMGLAAKISQVLRMDPTALFPDIFGTAQSHYEPKSTPGNRGSGMSGAAAGSMRKGGEVWTQGANG